MDIENINLQDIFKTFIKMKKMQFYLYFLCIYQINKKYMTCNKLKGKRNNNEI